MSDRITGGVISAPLQWSANFGMGQQERTQNVALFRPVLQSAIAV